MDLRRDRASRTWADNLTFDVELFAGTDVSPMRVAAGAQELPMSGAASFVHEACHQWSFTRMAGLALMCLQAWTLCDSRDQWYEWALNATGSTADEEHQVAASLARLEFVDRLHRLFRPLFEGLALYAELDARPKGNPFPPPLEWGSRLFEIERGWLPLTPDRRRSRFAAALAERRFTRAEGEGTLDRRFAVFHSPLAFEGDAYLPGYLFVRELRRKLPAVDDGMFLNLVVLFLLDDPRLAQIILDDAMSYRSRLTLAKEQLQRRAQILLEQAPRAEKVIRDLGLSFWQLTTADRSKVTGSTPSEVDGMWKLMEALGPTRAEVIQILDQKERLRVGTVEVDLVIRPYGDAFAISAEPRGIVDGRQLATVLQGDYEVGQFPAVAELFVELMGTEIYVAVYHQENRKLVELWQRDFATGRMTTIDQPDVRAQFDNSRSRRWLAEIRRDFPRLVEDYFLLSGVNYVRHEGETVLGMKEHDARNVRALLAIHDVPDRADVDALAEDLYVKGHSDLLGLRMEGAGTFPAAMQWYGIRGVFDDDEALRAFATWDACVSHGLGRGDADRVLRRETGRSRADVQAWIDGFRLS